MSKKDIRKRSRSGRLRAAALISGAVMMMFAAAGCGGGGYTSDEPCVWCNSTPTKQIASETEDTEALYYCEECSTTCAMCGEKATHHYTILLGAEVFLCDECD